jgi:hypothetical protein
MTAFIRSALPELMYSALSGLVAWKTKYGNEPVTQTSNEDCSTNNYRISKVRAAKSATLNASALFSKMGLESISGSNKLFTALRRVLRR